MNKPDECCGQCGKWGETSCASLNGRIAKKLFNGDETRAYCYLAIRRRKFDKLQLDKRLQFHKEVYGITHEEN